MNSSRVHYEASLHAQISYHLNRASVAPDSEKPAIHMNILALRVAQVRPQSELPVIKLLSRHDAAKNLFFRLRFGETSLLPALCAGNGPFI